MESITLEKLANLIGGTPLGSFDLQLSNLQDSKECDEHSVCYLKDEKFINTLSNNAGAVITNQVLADQLTEQNLIVVDDPYLAYASASKVFFQKYKNENHSIESVFGKNVVIGKNSVVNSNCQIGNNVVIHDNVSIYPSEPITVPE